MQSAKQKMSPFKLLFLHFRDKNKKINHFEDGKKQREEM